MKKKLISMLLCVSMTAAALVGCASGTSGSGDTSASAQTEGDVLKIGVYEPASGDNGAAGKQETLGIQYANKVSPTVEIDGKEYTVQLDIVDNESSNDKGPTAASKLVSDGVSIALGSYGSGVSIAASDIFKEAGIPVLGVTCTNPQVTEGNTHYFRICFLDPFQGTVLANLAVDQLGASNAYVLTKLGDDYSAGLGHYFTEAFENLGGTVTAETFQEGNSDFTSYIASAVKSGADVFFAPISTEAAALLIEQAAAQGLTLPLLAGDTFDSNVILNVAKGTDLSIYLTTFYQEGGNEEFDKGFKEWLASDSTALANNGGDDTIAAPTAMGYDAYFTALEAVKAAGSTDPAAINEALWNVDYSGVSGEIKFDSTGDAEREVAYIKSVNTADGTWEFVGVQGVDE